MEKLEAVERARALMTEAIDWPDWKWLFDKARVREAADLAAQAFERANNEARSGRSGDFTSAHWELISVAEREAVRVTREAEEMFAEAEKRLNAAMAREAAHKALESFELREQALTMALSAGRTSE